MAAPVGSNPASITEMLQNTPHRFDFFEAVRRLEWSVHEQGRFPVGDNTPPSREVVRFRTPASTAFAASAVTAISIPLRREPSVQSSDEQADIEPQSSEEASSFPEDDDPPLGQPQMTIAFMGLTGPNGVLPDFYTAELIREQKQRQDKTQDAGYWAFLDLFNHRVISLFFSAWRKAHMPMAYEQAKLFDQPMDDMTEALFALSGMGSTARGRQSVHDELFLYYAAQFGHVVHSAVDLENMLSDYFDMPVTVEQFCGRYLDLELEDRWRLGGPDNPIGELGMTTIVGSRVWEVQSHFRLRLGPLTLSQYMLFLPSGDALLAMVQLTRMSAGAQFEFDIQPVLSASEVPRCRLGGSPEQGTPRLGWTSWLLSRCPDEDFDKGLFSIDINTAAGKPGFSTC